MSSAHLKFYSIYGKTDKVNFYGPGLPWAVVQKLTKGIIQEVIKVYIEDEPYGQLLKVYHFATDIDVAIFNQM